MSTDGSTPAAAACRRAALAAAATLSLAGCTATPAPLIELSGTSWRVAQVNGRPTPTVGDYSMRFEQDRVGVRLGCNHMGGRYDVTGDVLALSDFATTLMGCPEPAGTFERDGSLVMARPMKMALTSNERLLLSNPAGSIALDPVP